MISVVMGALEAPDGRTWTVRRRWVPRLGNETTWGRFHRRYRQAMGRVGRVADADLGWWEVIEEGIAAAVVIALVVLAILFVGLPVLVALVDIAIVLALAALGLVARVAFRRPWTVGARASDGTTLSWRVVGWRASGLKLTEVEQLLASGVVPPPGAGSRPEARERRAT